MDFVMALCAVGGEEGVRRRDEEEGGGICLEGCQGGQDAATAASEGAGRACREDIKIRIGIGVRRRSQEEEGVGEEGRQRRMDQDPPSRCAGVPALGK